MSVDREPGAGVIGEGPFKEDLDETPMKLWLAVLLMCVGAGLLSGAIIAVSQDHAVALGLAIASVVVGMIGVVLAFVGKIMSNTA